MNTKEPGYVYILTNPSFREDWVKIGKSRWTMGVKEQTNQRTVSKSFENK